MLAEVVAALSCPVCGDGLREHDRSLSCGRGHAFDVARQGYATLRRSGGARHVGDDAAMVAARLAFFGSGAYDGLAARVADAARRTYAGGGLLLDVGGGTGFYAARALDGLAAGGDGSGGRSVDHPPAGVPANDGASDRGHPPGHVPVGGDGSGDHPPAEGPADDGASASDHPPAGLVLDASPYALRRAARAHPRLDAVGCDLWQRWPLQDGSAGVAIGVFAPRNGAEAARVLRAGGGLVVVTPGPGHLGELVAALDLLGVDEDKDARVAGSLEPHLERRAVEPYEQAIRLDRREVVALVGMGPSARHLEPATLARRVAGLPAQVTVTVSVRISEWVRLAT